MSTAAGTVSPATIINLVKQGQFARALQMGEQLLARGPADPRTDHLVGVVACQAGSHERGVALLGRALRARPDDAEIAFNLAKALADSGNMPHAMALTTHFARDEKIQRLKAELLKRTGDTAGAAEAWRRRTVAEPGNPDAWNNLGTALLAEDRGDDAVSALERARQLAPGQPVIARNLARALQLIHREDQALKVLADSHHTTPGDAGVVRDYGEALLRMLRAREALEVLADAARIDPTHPGTYVSIGLAYSALAEFARAEAAYFQALAIDPIQPAALLNLGVLLEQSNRIDQLSELVAGAKARGAKGSELTMLDVLLLRRSERFAEARDAAAQIKGGVDETMLAQTQAQLADRTGDPAEAFAHFERMNAETARSPVGRRFDGSEHRRYVEDMARIVTPTWVAAWQPLPPSDFPAPSFLVGFPRSGTTLLDTALLGHSRVHVLEEEPVLRHVGEGAGPLERIGQTTAEKVDALRMKYLEEVAKIAPSAGGKLILDKMPLSTLRGPLIARLFPDAPIVFALRHPCDAVLSCFMQNFRINQAMASFLTLENSARFYATAMAYWMQSRELLPLRVHEVRYEDLVEDPEAVLRPLVKFLGLEWEDAVLRHGDTALTRGFIRTPSYAQVTEGIYRRASGRWLNYRAQMAPVLDILAPWAIRFGYGDPREA